MSYEGIEEFICSKGHYWSVDAGTFGYASNSERKKHLTCRVCNSPAEYHCRIDETNGTDDDIPETYHGPKIEIGWTDAPAKDHYENKYFIKIPEYRPVLHPVEGNNGRQVIRWQKINSEA